MQTRPVVLFVVSWSSWTMFRDLLGGRVASSLVSSGGSLEDGRPHVLPCYLHGSLALPETPWDPDFTMLRATTDPATPCHLVLDVAPA